MVRVSTPQNRREREGHIFFPKDRFKPAFKVEIDYADGTTEDITNYVTRCTVQLGSTETMDNFKFGLDSPEYKFNKKFSGGEHIRIYLDYSDSSNLIMRGRLERWTYALQSRDGFKVNTMKGRAFPEFIDKLMSIEFVTRGFEDAISDIVSNYDDISFTKPEITTETITSNYKRMSGFAILRDMCTRFSLEFYIDTDGKINLMDPTSENSKITTDSITLQQNLMGVDEWSEDITQIKNRVFVNGKQQEFVTYLRTKGDEDSQSSLWVKDKDIFDSAISSNSEIEQRSEQELSKNLNSNKTYRLRCVGMKDARPGKRIYVSVPPLANDWFVIRSCSHVISDNGWVTNFSLNDSNYYDLINLLIERKKSERQLRPSGLDSSYSDCVVIDLKDSEDYSFYGTEMAGDKLKLESGVSTGTLKVNNTVPTLQTDSNTRYCFIKLNGNNIENCTATISNDDGLNTISFAGSEINSSKKEFSTLNHSHEITLTLQDGDSGSVSVTSAGIFLDQD